MTSAIPYDPEDFDNNPFAEQSTHGLISEEPQSQQSETVVTQPGPIVPPQSSIEDTSPISPLNRKPTEEELKRYIPEKYLKLKFSITFHVEDIAKNGDNDNGYKNPIIELKAVVRGLPGYRKTSYSGVRRTYKELELLNNYLKLNNLEVFVPLLPSIPTLYNVGSEEFKLSLIESIQIWFDRLSSNPILIKNPEFVLFLENSDFHYNPSRTKPSNIVMATGFKRKTLKQLQIPYDESQELASLRPLIKLTYINASKLKDTLVILDKTDKKLSHQNAEFFSKLNELNEIEPDASMKKGWSRLSKNLNVVNEIDLIKKHTTSSVLSDYLNLVIDDTYTIKESLTNRHLLMRELINAEDSTKKKHATIAKLRNKSVIDPMKVDEAILALEKATLTEKKLRRDVVRTTYNMLLEEDDYLDFLTRETKKTFKKLTLKTIESERKKLLVLENYRNDIREIGAIKGGLSRLGRENYPLSPTKVAKSQTKDGDSWSNRNRNRSSTLDTDDIVDQLSSVTMNGDDDGDLDVNDENTTVDAKSAANLLGPSTF